jgi:hypothetical protein
MTTLSPRALAILSYCFNILFFGIFINVLKNQKSETDEISPAML